MRLFAADGGQGALPPRRNPKIGGGQSGVPYGSCVEKSSIVVFHMLVLVLVCKLLAVDFCAILKRCVSSDLPHFGNNMPLTDAEVYNLIVNEESDPDQQARLMLQAMALPSVRDVPSQLVLRILKVALQKEESASTSTSLVPAAAAAALPCTGGAAQT